MTQFSLRHILLLLPAVLAAAGAASAPLPGASSPPGVNAAMTKLFGDFTAFSATAEARLLDQRGQESLRMPMQFRLRDSKICAEVDLSRLRSAQLSADTLGHLKRLGMDRMTTLVRPDLKTTFVVYPLMKAYVPLAMSGKEFKELTGQYQLTKSSVGRETIEGHPSDKCKVTLTDESGQVQEAFAWYASDLKGFPVQLQMTQGDGTVVMRFRDVQLKPPEAKAFEPPAGFDRHASVEELMQSAVMKLFGGGK